MPIHTPIHAMQTYLATTAWHVLSAHKCSGKNQPVFLKAARDADQCDAILIM